MATAKSTTKKTAAAKKVPLARKTVLDRTIKSATPVIDDLDAAPAAEAAPVVKKPRVKKPRATKAFAYQRVGPDGVYSDVSESFTSEKEMIDDVSLTANKDDTIILFREYKRGKINTKVKIG